MRRGIKNEMPDPDGNHICFIYSLVSQEKNLAQKWQNIFIYGYYAK